MKRKVCLNIGCGFAHKESTDKHKWYNIDIAEEVKPDLILNLDEQKLLFDDNEVDFIYSHHSFEHFKNWIDVLKEMYRVSKPGARWEITVPFGYCTQDNLHHYVTGFHFGSFDKLAPDTLRSYYNEVQVKGWQSPVARASGLGRLIPFKRFLSRWLNNVYAEITYYLEVVK